MSAAVVTPELHKYLKSLGFILEKACEDDNYFVYSHVDINAALSAKRYRSGLTHSYQCSFRLGDAYAEFTSVKKKLGLNGFKAMQDTMIASCNHRKSDWESEIQLVHNEIRYQHEALVELGCIVLKSEDPAKPSRNIEI